MKLMKTVFAFALCIVVTFANAGTFRVHQFTDRTQDGTPTLIADLVSDKFIERFPAKSWLIVVMATAYGKTAGGGLGHATVGVSPRVDRPLVPIRRFSAFRSSDGNRHLSAAEVSDLERMAIRDAVESLMEACSRSKDCDVYTK